MTAPVESTARRSPDSLRVLDGILGQLPVTTGSVCSMHTTRAWIEFMQSTVGGEPCSLIDPQTGIGFAAFRITRGDPPPPGDLVRLLTDRSWVASPAASEAAREQVKRISTEPWLPCLFVTFPGMATFPVPEVNPPVSEMTATVERVIRYADESGCRTVAFPYVIPEARSTAQALQRLGLVPLAESARADLAVHPDGLEGHVAALPKAGRRQIRRDLRDLTRARVHTTEEPLTAQLVTLIARLRCGYKRRYGLTADEGAERQRAGELLGRFGGDAGVTAFVSRRDRRPVRFSLFVRNGAVWHALWTGADYESGGYPRTYFDALFYEPLRAAQRSGISEITYGIGGDEAKRRRGCVLHPVRCFSLILPLAQPNGAAGTAEMAGDVRHQG